jgi:hypothetical protein
LAHPIARIRHVSELLGLDEGTRKRRTAHIGRRSPASVILVISDYLSGLEPGPFQTPAFGTVPGQARDKKLISAQGTLDN